MKSILIVATNLEIGGAERALLGLLNALDTDRVSVDLFLMRHSGPFFSLIPDKIHLLEENSKYADIGVPIKNVIKKGHLDVAFGRAIGKLFAHVYTSRKGLTGRQSVNIHYSYKYTRHFFRNISDKNYDLVLGFTVPYYIVDEKTKGRKKAVWLHTDYSMIAGDTKEEFRVWAPYDYIVSISDDVTKSFLNIFPSFKEKIIRIDNIISKNEILKECQLFNVENEMHREQDTFNLLSVGRFSDAKNFDNIPDICKRIIESGLRVKWYIIGDGIERDRIENRIRQTDMEKNVILLGKKDNPYPYILNCDVYVQPSRFEGKSVTVREAQILGKPVVITNYPTSHSQLMDGIDGIIVPMDNAGCASGIEKLLRNKPLLHKLSDNCLRSVYSNEYEVEKIYSMLEL